MAEALFDRTQVKNHRSRSECQYFVLPPSKSMSIHRWRRRKENLLLVFEIYAKNFIWWVEECSVQVSCWSDIVGDAGDDQGIDENLPAWVLFILVVFNGTWQADRVLFLFLSSCIRVGNAHMEDCCSTSFVGKRQLYYFKIWCVVRLEILHCLNFWHLCHHTAFYSYLLYNSFLLALRPLICSWWLRLLKNFVAKKKKKLNIFNRPDPDLKIFHSFLLTVWHYSGENLTITANIIM